MDCYYRESKFPSSNFLRKIIVNNKINILSYVKEDIIKDKFKENIH